MAGQRPSSRPACGACSLGLFSILLLDGLYAGSGGTRDDDGIYWRRVARYCIDGGLQAVLDEYIHHLAGEAGVDPRPRMRD